MILNYKIDDILYGWTITKIEPIDDLKGVATSLVHKRTGMEAFHFFNDDENNFFSFGFPTFPTDNTGVPHIIEHSVLAGSSKYPVKDPFLALLKGSVNTFMNALTYPEKTLYPAGSTHEKDYFNLLSLYGDCLFHPILSREKFEQEGIRLERDENGNIIPKGIVFNEMLGDVADPESLFFSEVFAKLLEDTCYAKDSGGDPAHIPELSYEDFIAFYEENYRPDRCKLYLYGNIPLEKRLAFLEKDLMEALPGLDPNAPPVNYQLIKQKIWNEPQEHQIHLRMQEGDDPRPEAVLAWYVGDVSNIELLYSWKILEEILFSASETPIARLLLESGLGDDLSMLNCFEAPSGLGVFICGMKGLKEGALELLKQKIFDSFTTICKEGFDPELIEGAIRQFEFLSRRAATDVAAGINIMKKVFSGWLSGHDPTAYLQRNFIIENIRQKWSQNPRYFEELLEDKLLNNPHYIYLRAIPDINATSRMHEKIDQSVQAAYKRELEKNPLFLEQRMEYFLKYQQQEDTSEQLAKIPRLSVAEVKGPIHFYELKNEDKFKFYEKWTNGITSFYMLMDTKDFSDDEIILLNVMGKMSLCSRTPEFTDVEVMVKTGLYYCVLTSSFKTLSIGDKKASPNLPKEAKSYFSFAFASLNERFNEGFDFFIHLITKSDFMDYKKLKEEIVLNYNDYKSRLFSNLITLASSRIQAEYSQAAHLKNLYEGLPYFLTLQKWKSYSKKELLALGETFNKLREKLFDNNRLSFFAVGENEMKEKYRNKINSFLKSNANSHKEADHQNDFHQQIQEGKFELFQLASGNANNLMAISCANANPSLQDSFCFLANTLSSSYLWNEIRMSGGAYGSSARYIYENALFIFNSYRDPNIKETYAKFEEGLKFFSENLISDQELDEIKISRMGAELQPLSPFKQGQEALADYYRQRNKEMAIKDIDEFFAVTKEEIKKAAIWLLAELKMQKSRKITFSGPQTINKDFGKNEIAEMKRNGDFHIVKT